MGSGMKDKYVNAIIIIDENTEIITANEDFYSLVSNEDAFVLSKDILAEEVDKLKDAIKEATTGKEAIVDAHLNVVDMGYRPVLMKVVFQGEDKNMGKLYKVIIRDVLSCLEMNENLRGIILRYSEIMSLTENVMFYYKQTTNTLKIFTMTDAEQTLNLYTGDLDEWGKLQTGNANLSAGDVAEINAFIQCLKSGEKAFSKDIKLNVSQSDNSIRKCSIKAKTSTDYDGITTTAGIIIVVADNNEMNTMQMSFVSDMKDAGTGLLNKRAITDYVRNLIDSKPDHNVTIAVIDIDDFKMVNDTYGHMFGDEVLNKVAEILKDGVGSKGLCGRIGGDEMFIMVEGLNANEDIRSVLRPIRNNIAWLYHDDPRNIKVTCSIGCATYPTDADNFDELFNIADKMLYLAKEKGKNRYIIYYDDLHYQYVYGTGKIMSTKEKAYLKYRKLDTVNLCVAEYPIASEERRKELLEILTISFDLDSIAIYDRKIGEKIQVYGKESFHKDDVRFFDSDNYISSFREDGLQIIDNIDFYEMKVPKLYAVFNHIGIKQAVQFIVCGEDREQASLIISFNRFRQEQKWATLDFSYLAIVGNIIGTVYKNDKKEN